MVREAISIGIALVALLSFLAGTTQEGQDLKQDVTQVVEKYENAGTPNYSKLN